MLAKGVDAIEGSTVISKRIPIKAGSDALLAAKVKDTSRSQPVDKKLLNAINPPFIFINWS
jgi:hypothetical protein